MANKIIPLIPTSDDAERYDPLAAFEFHMEMANRIACNAGIRILSFMEYPSELDTYVSSSFDVGDKAVDAMIDGFLGAVADDASKKGKVN